MPDSPELIHISTSNEEIKQLSQFGKKFQYTLLYILTFDRIFLEQIIDDLFDDLFEDLASN